MTTGPFHEGEIAVQERAGERELARRHGAGIMPGIVEGALPFLARQRLLAVTTAGDDGFLWSSLWSGEPGFVTSEDGQRVSILKTSASVSHDDPVLPRLAIGRDVGMLAIELTTRRRLRINGTVERISAAEIRIVVRESVGNCPKYIQRRREIPVNDASAVREGRGQSGRIVDAERKAFVERADTAFVGSVHAARGMDASHRGGAPGFIRAVDETTLRMPDYRGNSMFMTLGNFAQDSRASLAVVDFERGRAVAFSGLACLHAGADHPLQPTGGTGRYWDLAVRQWVQFDLSSTVRWELIDASPYNP